MRHLTLFCSTLYDKHFFPPKYKLEKNVNKNSCGKSKTWKQSAEKIDFHSCETLDKSLNAAQVRSL